MDLELNTKSFDRMSLEEKRQDLIRKRLKDRQKKVNRRGIVPSERPAKIPLSYEQKRLLILDKFSSLKTEYLVPLAFQLQGEIDREAIKRALDEMVARHEILRTKYSWEDDKTYQEPLEQVEISFNVINLKNDVDHKSDQKIEAVFENEINKPLDLASGEMLRATLIVKSENESILLFIIHHIAIDGWSTEIFKKEFFIIYQAFRVGEEHGLARPALQYIDYSLWQNKSIAVGSIKKQVEYWEKKLAGAVPLGLIPDMPRQNQWISSGDSIRFKVEKEVAERLKEIGRAINASPFMIYMAAYQLLLSRYTGQTNIIVGTPTAGRGQVELESLIGFFVNTLVIRVELSGEMTFVEYLKLAKQTVLEALENQDVPFDYLVNVLNVERELSRNPLFQVLFNMQNKEDPKDKYCSNLEVEDIDVASKSSKFDISLELAEQEDGSSLGSLEYSTKLFKRSTIRRMEKHFNLLLTEIAQHPEQPVSTYQILTDREKKHFLENNCDTVDVLPAGSIHRQIEEHVLKNPGAAALRCNGQSTSYGELNAKANRIGAELISLGVKPEEKIGVILERDADLICCLLGILKAGACYVPIEPTIPRARIKYIVDDAGMDFIITASAMRGLVEELKIDNVIYIEDIYQKQANGEKNLDTRVLPDQVAYIIYTSGSTGKPKGVQIPHSNVLKLFSATVSEFDFDAADNWSFFHSYSFDFSVWEIWCALLSGGTVVVISNETARSPDLFLDTLVAEEVSVLSQTPSAFRSLVDMVVDNDYRFKKTALKFVVFGGEALELSTLIPWFNYYLDKGPRMINMYGITETTVHVTIREIQYTDPESNLNSPIGPPLASHTAYILDEHLNIVPCGVTGELYIGGGCVCRGYLNRPGLTASTMIPNPFSNISGGRIYKTGDLARYLESAEIEYMGRADKQVKIRGYRIELGEVEAVAGQFPGIKSSIVTVNDRLNGEKQLVGYYIGEHEIDIKQFKEHLRSHLPSYMVPAFWLRIDSVPLTSNGKVDYKSLPEPSRKRNKQESVFTAAKTPLQQQMVAIWEKVLGIENIRIHDNFFDLGGDSIRAIHLIGTLKKEKINVSIQDLFKARDIAHLSEYVKQEDSLNNETLTITGTTEPFSLISKKDRELQPAEVYDAYPLSMVQLGMLYELCTSGENYLYHNVTNYMVRDTGHFSEEALDCAINRIISRHDIFRTAFDLDHFSIPLQQVYNEVLYKIKVNDYTGMTEGEQSTLINKFFSSERTKPVSLNEAPLFRLTVFLLDEQKWRFILTENHAILDGWSHNSFLTELIDEYKKVKKDPGAAENAQPPLRYADYIALEQKVIQSQKMKGFWSSIFADYPSLKLPSGWGDINENIFYDVSVNLKELTPELNRLAVGLGVSVKSVLLATHLKVMSYISGQVCFQTGLVWNGRPEVLGSDKIYGMFLNTLPFPVELNCESGEEFINKVFETETEIAPNRFYPMPALNDNKEKNGALIEVIFNYLNFHNLDVGSIDLDETVDISPNEFVLHVSTTPAELILTMQSQKISVKWGHFIASVYEKVLEYFAREPSLPMSRYHLGTLEQKWSQKNATDKKIKDEHVFISLFEETASQYPGKTALSCGEENLTYDELNSRSNKLAHYLAGKGVGPGTLLGISLSRDSSLIIAILGILKAGGAYLPLDPAYPDLRLDHMIHDSKIEFLITNSLYEKRYVGKKTDLINMGNFDESGFSGENIQRRAVLKDLAYIIYTSGSTGKPKGVMISHEALANFALSMIQTPGISGEDIVLAVTTESFDISILEMLVPLLTGARVVMAGQKQARDPQQLALLLKTSSATIFQATPSSWQMLMNAGWQPGEELRIFSGGEKLPADLKQKLLKTGVPVWDLYGPTETTIWSSIAQLSENDTCFFEPVANTQLYVVSEGMELTPPGVEGELYIGGTGLSRGYLNRPGLTADRFIPDPFSTVPGQRCYKTGDNARYLENGIIEILGRVDSQLKIRGHRIEAGEIETRLKEHGLIKEAVVHGVNTLGEGVVLAAYLIAEESGKPDNKQLRSYLKESLPDYMIPTRFVYVNEYPKTSNGKTDKKRLAEIEVQDNVARELDSSEMPQNELENEIAEVWAKVLNLPCVGRNDDFFDLGGHSMLIMVLVNKLQQKLGCTLSFLTILEKRTVSGVADWLNSSDQKAGGSSYRSLLFFDRAEGKEDLFCVHPGGGSGHWFMPLAEELKERFNVIACQWPQDSQLTGKWSSVEEAAAYYLSEMKKFQPSGPYHILGWCGGASYAWHLVHLLEKAGEKASCLFVDPVLDDSERENFIDDLENLRDCEHSFRLLESDIPQEEKVEHRKKIAAFIEDFVEDDEEFRLSEEFVDGQWRKTVNNWRQLLELRMKYSYAPMRHKINLILSDELISEKHPAIYGLTLPQYLAKWNSLVEEGVVENNVRGMHLSILQAPYIHEFADTITGLLRK